MEIKIIENKKEWDEFVQKQPFYTFINSWDWGEFNELMGSKIFRLGFYEGERLEGLALVIKIEARRGAHLFCPYGPMFEEQRGLTPLEGVRPRFEAYFNKLKEILPELIKLAKKEDACFLRIHPTVCCDGGRDGAMLRLYNGQGVAGELSPCRDGALPRLVNLRNPKDAQREQVVQAGCPVFGFRPAPIHVHAEDTWLLDLVKSAKMDEGSKRDCDCALKTSPLPPPLRRGDFIDDEELLANMRKTTRYMIKRAIKEGVRVEKNNSEEYIDKFIEMHKKHSSRERGSYTAFSDSYIRNLFKVFPERDINLMYAEYNPACHSETRNEAKNPVNYSSRQGILRVAQNDIDSAKNIEAMLVSIKYGKTTAYYLGASDIKHPKFSPAYLLQWEAIKKAREAGCTVYNFWGVAPDVNPSHPLAGVTLFKKGFGGYDYKIMHAQDMPLSSKYWLNWAVESMRRVRRGYYYKNS